MTLVIATLIIVGYIGVELMTQSNDLSDQMLENIEAISQNESSGNCIEWCYQNKDWDCILVTSLGNKIPCNDMIPRKYLDIK